mmetsp:Transcript_22535/g.44618  ORF Transcript_22535/g.44618 Transcript_22535/m.44618 type:complete len:103 (+) Transcript_22535:213-521(+)
MGQAYSNLAASSGGLLPPFLTVRADSLLARTSLGAAIYYAPQNVAALSTGLLLYWAARRSYSSPTGVSDPESAWKTFLKQKGVDEKHVNLHKGMSSWKAEFF